MRIRFAACAVLVLLPIVGGCAATNRMYQSIHIPDGPSRLEILQKLREGTSGAYLRSQLGTRTDGYTERLENGHRYTTLIYKEEGRLLTIALVDDVIESIQNDADPTYVPPVVQALQGLSAALAATNPPQGEPVIIPTAGGRVVAPALSNASVIESRISGEFTGWSGDTVFVLENGQVWQQAAYAYRYHYAYKPKVVIVHSGAGYSLHVDGIDQAVAVKRLR